MEYILVQDNDCHWYVIPSNKSSDFYSWCELDSEAEISWVAPSYAEQVGGCPSLVKFKEFRIE